MELAELPAVHFADPEGFTFMPLLLDVWEMEMQFRIVQQGYTGSGLCNSLSMRYSSPKLDHPSHCIEVKQRDLVLQPHISCLGIFDLGHRTDSLRGEMLPVAERCGIQGYPMPLETNCGCSTRACGHLGGD